VRQSVFRCETVLLESLTGPAAGPIVRQRASGTPISSSSAPTAGAAQRLVMGSDAEQIVRNAPVP